MKRRAVPLVPLAAASAILTPAISGCFERGDRWLAREEESTARRCELGERRCAAELEECVSTDDGPAFRVVERCTDQGLVCAPGLSKCTACVPGAARCDGFDVERCNEAGDAYERASTCSGDGIACRDGACVSLCGIAAEQRSNVGCEYWAADLDNANIDESLNAAAQQFAVVLSNPQPDLTATVRIERDDSAPGEPPAVVQVAESTINPFSLQVFRLGPREVDGSPPGEFNTGTHTARTRAAYRIRTSVPVVAYQFNPLENVNVFSNDASLLKPVEALGEVRPTLERAYVVLGWPQTIAITDDPDTTFDPLNPIDLRAFLTIVGTRPGTNVRVTSATRILGGGDVPEVPAGGTLEATLDPFDVLNLETDDFNADFTGSIVEADGPIVVFSGSEASDAPFFRRRGERSCCADHLEEQLDPIRTAGKRFVATVSSNRSVAMQNAGAVIGVVDAPEFFRVIAATDAGARVRTTLGGRSSEFSLSRLGDFRDLESSSDFVLESDEPVMFASVSASQEAAGIPSGLPGGDPSFLIIPPIEQFRSSYVFLTPDRYAFDFVRIVAPVDATVRFDDVDVDDRPECERATVAPIDEGRAPEFAVYRCQLGFPRIDPSPGAVTLSPGIQNDGVHQIVATRRIGVIVDGFDRNVSYAYAAGTELTEIVPR